MSTTRYCDQIGRGAESLVIKTDLQILMRISVGFEEHGGNVAESSIVTAKKAERFGPMFTITMGHIYYAPESGFFE